MDTEESLKDRVLKLLQGPYQAIDVSEEMEGKNGAGQEQYLT
jgi:hypothetical protein